MQNVYNLETFYCTITYSLYFIQLVALLNAVVLYENALIIRCNIKLRSVGNDSFTQHHKGIHLGLNFHISIFLGVVY
jgi:hypothetical protein